MNDLREQALEAIASIRDSVLHERHQLAEMNADNDIINAVLGIIDDETIAFEATRLVPAGVEQGVPVTDENVEQVEFIVGMGHRAWDMVDPKELIAACNTTVRLERISAKSIAKMGAARITALEAELAAVKREKEDMVQRNKWLRRRWDLSSDQLRKHDRYEVLERMDRAEAKLAFLKTKGITVTTAKTSDRPEPYLVYLIEPGSELSDDIYLEKIEKLEAERDELRKACERLEAQWRLTREIESRYTDRWLAAFEKFRKTQDNAEATKVFREFLKEEWTANRISESFKELEQLRTDIATLRQQLAAARAAHKLDWTQTPQGWCATTTDIAGVVVVRYAIAHDDKCPRRYRVDGLKGVNTDGMDLGALIAACNKNWKAIVLSKTPKRDAALAPATLNEQESQP